jgi:hypothetical protein
MFGGIIISRKITDLVTVQLKKILSLPKRSVFMTQQITAICESGHR